MAQSCPTLCNPMNRSTPGLPVHHQLPEFTQTHVHRVSDAIQASHPLSSPSPPAPNPSQHQSLFQWVNSSHEVAKVLSFSFSIIPSKEISGLISFRMYWLDLLAVQGTLTSLLGPLTHIENYPCSYDSCNYPQYTQKFQSCSTLVWVCNWFSTLFSVACVLI